MRGIVEEADALGISFFVIAGGEPLTRPEIVDIARDHSRVIFLLVTNGLLLDEALIAKLTRLPNVVPVLSIEGGQAETDERRGCGVHERLQGRMELLRRAGIFFSLSPNAPSNLATRASRPEGRKDGHQKARKSGPFEERARGIEPPTPAWEGASVTRSRLRATQTIDRS